MKLSLPASANATDQPSSPMSKDVLMPDIYADTHVDVQTNPKALDQPTPGIEDTKRIQSLRYGRSTEKIGTISIQAASLFEDRESQATSPGSSDRLSMAVLLNPLQDEIEPAGNGAFQFCH